MTGPEGGVTVALAIVNPCACALSERENGFVTCTGGAVPVCLKSCTLATVRLVETCANPLRPIQSNPSEKTIDSHRLIPMPVTQACRPLRFLSIPFTGYCSA